MSSKPVAVLLLCLVGVVLFSVHAAADEAMEQKAVTAAKAWLALVDSGDYEKSWNTAAEYFQNAVAQQQWQQSLTAARKPLGKVVSRQLKAKQYTTSLPDAPDGQYVVIQYETSFENKKSAVETITPMLNADGQWRVAGYYIK
jgi:Protein of unknown function (DUF4019)